MKIKRSEEETIINESDTDEVFQSISTTVISNKEKFLGKGSGQFIDSVAEHSISKYNPLAGINYIKFPKELYHPRKGVIIIKNIDDNECFKWSLVRYLNLADHHLGTIAKADKDFTKNLNFKGKKFPVKVKDIHKIEKNNSIDISFSGYENKEKHPVYV